MHGMVRSGELNETSSQTTLLALSATCRENMQHHASLLILFSPPDFPAWETYSSEVSVNRRELKKYILDGSETEWHDRRTES